MRQRPATFLSPRFSPQFLQINRLNSGGGKEVLIDVIECIAEDTDAETPIEVRMPGKVDARSAVCLYRAEVAAEVVDKIMHHYRLISVGQKH